MKPIDILYLCRMKAFISWSSGKDCMYALYRFLKNTDNKVVCLLNMSDIRSDKSRSHGISNGMIRKQAAHLNIPLLQKPTSRNDYEKNLKEVISQLKSEGIDSGVFGDICLQEHRVWIERVCGDMGVSAVFPLWGEDTNKLVEEFIDDGFKTIVVSVRKEKLSQSFLGRLIDNDFLAEIRSIPSVDPCGENGEYHTFVYDGPLFTHPISFKKGNVIEDDKHWFLEIK